MKMKPGPKAVLWMLMVVALLSAGFWAGRGFPRTWQAVMRTNTLAATDPAPAPTVSAERVDALENRIDTLEHEVATLHTELYNARTQPPQASAPTDGGASATPVQPQSSRDPQGPDNNASIDYR